MTKEFDRATKIAIGIITRDLPSISSEMAGKLYVSAVNSGEITRPLIIDEWLKTRLIPSFVILNNEDYIVALTHALKIAPTLAGTDYGSSRQRDLGQLWTDSARGFLGEIAIKKLLKKRFNVEVELDYSQGPIDDYLPSDIKSIKFPDGSHAHSTDTISIKTTKFNGIWLDIPGAQVEHSNIFVLVKLGISRNHFVGFLKGISFVKDKLLPSAMRIGTIDEEQAQSLWDSLPGPVDIPSYIPGFLYQTDFSSKIVEPRYRIINKRNGSKSYVLTSYVGRVIKNKPIDVPSELTEVDWQFQSIGDFSSEPHYISNTGSMRYSDGDWQFCLNSLKNIEVK